LGEKKHADGKVGSQLAGVGPSDLGIRWFELADVGLEVIADGKTAVVKRVAEKSPFAGKLEAKDVLTAINGTKVTTPDECRRALRRAVVLGYAVLDVQRDGKAVNRLVRVADVLK
jgi:S1-C subfamily serine protease